MTIEEFCDRLGIPVVGNRIKIVLEEYPDIDVTRLAKVMGVHITRGLEGEVYGTARVYKPDASVQTCIQAAQDRDKRDILLGAASLVTQISHLQERVMTFESCAPEDTDNEES